jgi:hypothetical protein
MSKLLLSLRKHQQFFVNGPIERIEKEKTFDPRRIGILVVGMWSGHQCKIADQKLQELSPQVDTFLKKCRGKGMKVIFGSQSLVKHPKYVNLRKNMKNIAFAKLEDKGLSFPPIPFDDSDGGVNERNPSFQRGEVDLNPQIEVSDTDAMTDNCKELLNYLYHHNCNLLLVVGVHTNMCVLDRPYGMKNIARYGFPMAIVRDLADPMIKPDGVVVKDREDALNKIIRYVEQYFAPSVDSRDFMFLDEGKQIIRCDIDETICVLGPEKENEDNHPYKRKIPLTQRIERMNQLKEQGNCIVYWTSRGIDSDSDWSDYTRKQLTSWGVQYDAILVGKRRFDLLIDDKVINSEVYFEK